MMTFTGSRVFIAVGATDMRKSINGLSLLVEEEFGLDLFSGSFFAFCNRKRDLVKILYWSGNGFCIWMKRLEEEVFRWPDSLHIPDDPGHGFHSIPATHSI